MLFTFSWMGYFLAMLGLLVVSVVLTTLCGLEPKQPPSAPGAYEAALDAGSRSHSPLLDPPHSRSS